MALEVKKREGETPASFLFRFNKRVQRSGLVKEIRKRQFKTRTPNKTKRRSAALYRGTKQRSITKERKYGV